MSKRIFAAFLALCILLSLSPVVRAAESDQQLTPIMAWQKEYRVLDTYREGNDLLMTAADISWLTSFSYEESGDIIRFTRGSKTVNVNTKSHLVYLSGSNSALDLTKLTSACRNIDGTWYLSLAGILPWLNTYCTVRRGVLAAVPNPVSLWDVNDSFDPAQYAFTADELLALGATALKGAGSLGLHDGLGVIYYYAGDGQNSNMGEELDYYHLFEDMIQDVTASDRSVSTWMERYSNIEEFLGFLGTGVGFWDEAMGEAFDTDIMSNSQSALKLFSYWATFQQDGENKVALLQTLVNGTDGSSNSGMVSAALSIIDNYTDFWAGLFNTAMDIFVTGLPDGATNATVLGMLGYVSDVSDSSYEQVSRITLYNNLINEAMDGYRCYSGETTLTQLEDYVNFISIYLYATEQNYRAMAAYLKDTNPIPPPEYYIYLEKAEALDEEQALFLNISLLLEYDCSDLGPKREASAEYLHMFPGLNPDLVPHGITAAAEQAIYWAALEDMNVYDPQWAVTDLDLDEETELLVRCYDSGGEFPTYLVIDPNQYATGHYEGYSFFEYLYLRQNSRGQYCIQQDNSEGILSDTVQVWTGRIFKEVLAEGLQDASLPSVDLTEQNFAGNPEELMHQLDTYFSWRNNCYRYSYDLNGDGYLDRVYILPRAADNWTELYNRDSGYSSALYYEDDKVTVLVAEYQPQGIRLRVCRTDFPDYATDAVIQEDGTLVVGDRLYTYQPSGKPFVSQKNTFGVTAADLLGLDPDQIRMVLDEYYEDDNAKPGTAYGYFDGAYLSMTFSEYYGADEEDSVLVYLSVNAWDGERVPLIDQLCTGDTVLDFLENTPSLSDMTDFSPVGAYYEVSASYRDAAGNAYIFTAAFDGNTTDAVLAYGIFSRVP